MTFQWKVDEFADIQVLRYQVPGFDLLNDRKKELLYYLYQAALAGRDIAWDQNYKYNLYIRHVFETIYSNRPKDCDQNANWTAFIEYLKRTWVSNGIHHHYSNAKFEPAFSREFLQEQLSLVTIRPPPPGCNLIDIIFDPNIASIKVQQDTLVDCVAGSACNFYQGVTEKEVHDYYAQRLDTSERPVAIGLNSKLVGGVHGIVEMPWTKTGMYGKAISEICKWLDRAIMVTESHYQKVALESLIKFFETGDPKHFDEYCVNWLKDTDYDVDVICGFMEDYQDPLNRKCSFETVVTVRDPEASLRMELLCKNAQWFENNSPVMAMHKKKVASGINARVVNVVIESGDASPTTPIGICLPNSDWIRKQHGSKSINMDNIINACDAAATKGGGLEEFCYSQTEVDRAKKYLEYSSKVAVDLHEVLGHGSGQTEPGVDPTAALKGYSGVIEEARADLFALWYIVDPKMIEIGVIPNLEAAKSVYDSYIRNGLMTQLRRIKLGNDIQQTHMRQRQMICKWLCVNTDSIKLKIDNSGKIFYQIDDYDRMRDGIGRLLCEVQRIKSSGDYEAAKDLVETFGVKIDPHLHAQILERTERLGAKAYSAFVNPKLTSGGSIEFPDNFAEQMLEYSKYHSTLPDYNTRPLTIYIDSELFPPADTFLQMSAAGHIIINNRNCVADYYVTNDTCFTPKHGKVVIFNDQQDWGRGWHELLY